MDYADSFHWQLSVNNLQLVLKPHSITEGFNLGTGYSSHVYASTHTPLGRRKDTEVEPTIYQKEKFSSRSAGYSQVLPHSAKKAKLTKVLLLWNITKVKPSLNNKGVDLG